MVLVHIAHNISLKFITVITTVISNSTSKSKRREHNTFGTGRRYGKSQFDVRAYDDNNFEEFLSESERNDEEKFAT